MAARQRKLYVWFLILAASAPPSGLGADTNSGGSLCPEDPYPQIDAACFAAVALHSSTATMSFRNLSVAILGCVGLQQSLVQRALRLVAPGDNTGSLESLTATLSAMTGWNVTYTHAPLLAIGPLVLDSISSLGRSYYDGWMTTAASTADLAEASMIEPLDSFVSSDPSLQWEDVHRLLRTRGAVYNGTVTGVPLGASVSLMYWRRDVFTNAKLAAPRTWREVLQVARALNGTDFNDDGAIDYALCLDVLKPLDDTSRRDPSDLLSQILASITQSQGINTGWLFDPQTMRSFVDTPAMSEALDILSQLLQLSAPPQLYNDTKLSAFLNGSCALQFAYAETFKGAQLFGRYKGQIASDLLPGSEVVLDRASGTLVKCSASTCPYATAFPRSGKDGPVLVNLASYSCSSQLGMVNRNAQSFIKAAAYQGLSVIGSPQVQLMGTLRYSPFSPIRYSHMANTTSNLARWRAAGYNTIDVAQYLDAVRRTYDHPNIALDLRIRHSDQYREALALVAPLLANGSSLAAVQRLVSERFAAVTALCTLQELGDTYLAGLNIQRKFQVPQPPSPAPASSRQKSGDDASPSSSTGLSQGAQAGIIAGCIVGGVVLIVLAVLGGLAMTVVAQRTHRRWGLFGKHLAPGLGPSTTLVVTDIENSTSLWESLHQAAMDTALGLHHSLARKLLVQHAGYESATEGDSFILAFHSPAHALRFAQAFQAELLLLEWPEELLGCELTRTVYATPAKRHNLQPMPSGGLSPRSLLPDKHGDVVSTSSLSKAPSTPTAVHSQADVILALPAAVFGQPSSTIHQMLSDTASRPHSSLVSAAGQSQTAAALFSRAWAEHPMSTPASVESRTLAYRGLRVRVGMDSGVEDAKDVVVNATTGRTEYSGRLLSAAKAVADCGHGGMVLLSHAAFSGLTAEQLQACGQVLNMGEYRFKAGSSAAPGAVYQVLAPSMECRLSLSASWQLRSVTQLQAGTLQAPTQGASIAFCNVVGAAALLAWDAGVAGRALLLFHKRATELMMQQRLAAAALDDGAVHQPGYVVELAGGLCLAAFPSSFLAVCWAVDLVDDLLGAPWEPELLANELCEEVVVAGAEHLPQVGFSRRSNTRVSSDERQSHAGVRLFRGLRLKVGIDQGEVHASINPSTGRMCYRGRVMNRAARVADKATCGQVWCSRASWDALVAQCAGAPPVDAFPLGDFSLKGVAGLVEVLQCSLKKALDGEAV